MSRDTDGRISPEECAEWAARQNVFTGLASFEFDDVVFLNMADRVEHFDAIRVTTTLFDVLAVTPVVGRTFGAEDGFAGAPAVAILGERVWRRVFGGDPAIIGRSVALSTTQRRQPVVIIGVVPDGLDVRTFLGDGIDLYRPISDGAVGESGSAVSRHVIARLRVGVNLAAAQSRMSAVALDVTRDLELTRTRLTGVRLVPLHEELYGGNRSFVALLGMAAGFVLLVAWANSVGVVLALATRRSRERAIRVALGASRSRLMGAAVTEAAIIGVASAAFAWVLSRWLVVGLIALAPPAVRRMNSAGIGWFESLCGAGLALCCALILGIAPAAIQRGRGLGHALRGSSGMTMGRSMLRIRRIGGRNSRHQVIGVVGNVREQNLDMALDPAIYMPVAGMTPSRLVLLTKESGPIGPATENLIAAFRRVDSELYVNVTPLADRYQEQAAAARLQATLLVGLAAFTLLLAGLGVYAMVAQLATDRAKELGVRSALGASSVSLVTLLMGTVLSSAMAGVAGGLVLSWLAVRMIQRFLFDTSPFDPLTWMMTVLVLISAAALAAWLPARRAASADPALALRDN